MTLSEQTYEGTFHVGEKAELTLRNVRGGIDITGWERPQVSIVAVKRLGSEWGARESFDETVVEMEQDGPRVRVRTRRKGGGGLLGWMGIGRTAPQVFYTVKVPATSDVSVRTVDGPITIADVIGSIYAKTVGGVIELKRVSGQVIASCVNATIRGGEVGGSLAVKTINGQVIVAQSRLSSFWAKTVEGSVHLETVIDPGGSYEVGSVNGSLHMLIPPDSRASVEMKSVNGHASCDLPCRVIDQGFRHWQADINGGGAPIRFKSVNGQLTIAATTKLPSETEPPPEPAKPSAPSAGDWPEMAILKAVERGEMSVEDAVAKLAELDKA